MNGDKSTSSKHILAKIEDALETPSWAFRSVPLDRDGFQGEVRIARGNGQAGQVTVSNQEMSWEPFYVEVVGPSAPSLRVTPGLGSLAPRGGAANACGGPRYSDSVRLTVFFEGEREGSYGAGGWGGEVGGTLPEGSAGEVAGGATYLIVRTELDYWSWRVTVVD